MTTQRYKAPRLIQARDPTFNIEYGRYIKPLELTLKSAVQFGKGTNKQIADKIWKLSRKWTHYTELDHKDFDAHVTLEMLKLTHIFYQSCYKHCPQLRRLSKRTLVNKCRTRNKIKYTAKGSRMSGDVDTGFGNSLINYAILKEVLKELGIDCDVIVNGDDSIIFTMVPLPIDLVLSRLLKYNMESKMPKPTTTDIFSVEFCRQKLILNNMGEPTLVILPDRLTTIFGMTYRPTANYQLYLRDVIRCFVAINSANPFCKDWLNLHNKHFDSIDYHDLTRLIDKCETTRDYRRQAKRELLEYPDLGEYNQYVYHAFGSLDDYHASMNKIDNTLTKLTKLPRMTTQDLQTFDVTNLIFINHGTKTITQMTQ